MEITKEDFESRFFAFYKDIPERRDPLLAELERLLRTELPEVLEAEADKGIERFRQESTDQLQATIGGYQSLVKDRNAAQARLRTLRKEEPERVKMMR